MLSDIGTTAHSRHQYSKLRGATVNGTSKHIGMYSNCNWYPLHDPDCNRIFSVNIGTVVGSVAHRHHHQR